jgi:large subunit ribosomal protein L25
MAVMGKLAVTRRAENGSKQCRRLRATGRVPGNIYGHKQAPVPLSAASVEFEALVRGGARVLDVEVDGHAETAIVREVQWDFLSRQIVHFDLVRVDPNEKLTVEVRVELKGTAPGAQAGGVIDHTLRTLTVECLAIQIPESIPVKIGTLEMGQALYVRDLEIPPNTRILNNPDAVVVRVAQPGAEVEAAAVPGAEGPAQPEVIGRKAAEAEDEAEAEEKKK